MNCTATLCIGMFIFAFNGCSNDSFPSKSAWQPSRRPEFEQYNGVSEKKRKK